MKKQLLFLMVLLVVCSAFSAEVTEQQAMEKARQFLNGKSFVGRKGIRRAPIKDDTGRKDYYIFNVEDHNGFVIVAGDDRLPDILGYSDKGSVDMNHIPCNMKWLLDSYANMIDSLDTHGVTRAFAPRRSVAMTPIEPLITTHWGQREPYNKLCPEIHGTRCLTGCVATAMAQIINYKRWPQGQTSSIEPYTTTSSGISMPELQPTSFDWDHMSEDDIARLMLYCGQSVQMNYDISDSSADLPDNAFKNAFGYSKSLYTWLGKLFTAEHLEQHIYNELAEDRPVYYSSASSLGGHAFVVDGYKDGLFHVNWGWNGDMDGYFELTASTEDVMPFPFNYTTNVLMGIEAASTDANQAKVIAKNIKHQGRCVYRKNSSEDFTSPLTITCNFSCDLNSMDSYVGLGLYREDGSLVKVLSPQRVTLPHKLKCNDEINDVVLGTYHLIPVYRHQETDEWKKTAGSNQWFFILHVDEMVFYIEDPVDEWNGNYQNYGIHEIDGVTYLLEKDHVNWAYALPYQVTGKYSGDIVIPSQVQYNGMTFRVKSVEIPALEFCENLTSLSLAMDDFVQISDCPNLSQITLNQGQQAFISFCPKLESLEFPISMTWVYVNFCENLKTMKFNNILVGFNTVEWDQERLPSLTDVYFASPNPPNVGTMGAVNPRTTIHIPIGSLQYYQQSQWKDWKIVEDQKPPFVTWGYCHDDNVTNHGFTIGTQGGDNNYEAAMRIPSEELEAYKGTTITHIEVFSGSRAINDWGYEDYEYVFITKPGTDYLVKQPFEVIRGIWNTVKLDEPYTITGEEIYVGVGRHGQIGLSYSDMTFVPDAAWCRFMGDDTSARCTIGKWDYVRECPLKEGPSQVFAHPLPIRFAIEGDAIPEGVVIRELDLLNEDGSGLIDNLPDFTGSRRRAAESGKSLKGVIRNRSLDTVTSYTIEWSIDGGEKQSKTIETHLNPNATETTFIELPALTNGTHTVNVNVTMVNAGTNKLEGVNMPTLEFTITDSTVDIGAIHDSSPTTGPSTIYDLQGRQVTSMKKGVYIKDGQKLLIP